MPIRKARRIYKNGGGFDMEKIAHYIWASEIVDKVKHFSECKLCHEPFISLSKEKEYALITIDTLPMYEMGFSSIELLTWNDFDKRYQDKFDKLPKMFTKVDVVYKAYCDTFTLPEDRYLISGVNGAFALAVYAEHAEFVAEWLYHYMILCRDEFVLPAKEVGTEKTITMEMP
jgi:hypothetical protein